MCRITAGEMKTLKRSLADYCRTENKEYLLTQWDTDANGDLSPETVSYGSSKAVWWNCSAGHSWQSPVSRRTAAGAGCPYCSHRLIPNGDRTHPQLAAQWSAKNSGLSPGDIPAGSHKIVWWTCERGHEWKASVKSRSEGSGCPVCTGRVVEKGVNDLASVSPVLASEWCREKNGNLHPEDVSAYSSRRVWWKCDKGHSWQAYIHARTGQGTGCPECAGRKKIAERNRIARLRLETERLRMMQIPEDPRMRADNRN